MSASTASNGDATTPPVGVVRVTTFRAQAGRVPQLQAAAQGNAREARQAEGCRSAEVCTVPDDGGTVLVISRWETAARLQAFLDWHENLAHGVMSPHAAAPPHSVHYPVISTDR